MSQQPSRCIFLGSYGVCAHPVIHGQTDDAKCALCPQYRGSKRGLGDVVHAVTVATGIEALAAAVGCGGCAKRRAALNAAVPFTDTAQKD